MNFSSKFPKNKNNKKKIRRITISFSQQPNNKQSNGQKEKEN
jgi:hypothetical protein